MGLEPAPQGYPIKLVRDNTASIVNPTNKPGDLFYAPVPMEHRLSRQIILNGWLKKKLVEEVAEFLVHGGDDELADVYAVVMALEKYSGVDLAKSLADDPRGGFFNGILMFGYHSEFDGRGSA